MPAFDTFSKTIPFVLGLALAGCSGSGSSDDPDDDDTTDETPPEVSLSCDQTLDFPNNDEGVADGATAQYKGLRYVALGDELCAIDTEDGSASTAMPLEGVEGMLEPVLTIYDVGADESDRVKAVVFPSGNQLFKATAGEGESAGSTSAFSGEDQASGIDYFRGTIDMQAPESTPLTYRMQDEGKWSAVNLDDPEAGAEGAPRDFPEGYVPLGPIHNDFSETTGWIVVDNDAKLATVDIGDEAEVTEYRESDINAGPTGAGFITTLDTGNGDPTVILRVGADEFVAYDPDEDEFDSLGTVSGSLSDLEARYATDGENVFVAYTHDNDNEAVLYRISEQDDPVEELDRAGAAYDTAPAFVIATSDRVVWGWNPSDGEDEGSEVVSMEADGSDDVVILDTAAGGTDTGHAVSTPVTGPADDNTVFFNELNMSPEFGGEGSGDPAFKAHAADATAESDPVLETYEDAQWQGSNAESLAEKRRGAVTSWSVSEIFISQQNDEGESELRVVPGNDPSDDTYLGDLSPTVTIGNLNDDLDDLSGPQMVIMRNFGLGPYRLMMVGSDLVMVDTRHRNSLITLAVEDPTDPSISLFRAF